MAEYQGQDLINAGGEEGAGVSSLGFAKGSSWCPVTGEVHLPKQEQPSGSSSCNVLFSVGLVAPLTWCEECAEPLLL